VSDSTASAPKKAYSRWIREYIPFHRKRHPAEMPIGSEPVSQSLDVSTTMIYTHVMNKGGKGVRSPLDTL
jgi:hypothetical protein